MDNTAEFLLWKNSDEKLRLAKSRTLWEYEARLHPKANLRILISVLYMRRLENGGRQRQRTKSIGVETRVLASRNEFTEDEGYSLMQDRG